MTATTTSAPAVFGGAWMGPTHPEYEAALPVFNRRNEGRPKIIARCANVADVVAAVRHARKRAMRIDVRSTGFNIGLTSSDGMVVDLSPMRDVQIRAEERTARIQGGVRGGDLQIAAAQYGLGAVTGAVSGSGIGLMLGGGVGLLSPRVGWASDNILGVEVVTADGEVVNASPDENPDLFWAVRGTTGNFGVVTALEVRLHEVPPLVHYGAMVWSLDNLTGGIAALRSTMTWAPEDLGVISILSSASLGGRGGLEVYACHSGPAEQARRDLERLRSGGTSPDEESVTALPFSDLHFVNDDAFPPMRATMDEESVNTLSDEVVEALVNKVREPAGAGVHMIEIVPRRGAFERPPAHPSALRETGENPTWSIGPAGWWDDEAEDEQHERWTAEVCAELRRVGSVNHRRHPNTVASAGLDLDGLGRLYGDRLPRLRQLKRHWDPMNVFPGNLNIPPADR